jgi:hydrogenase maturation protease
MLKTGKTLVIGMGNTIRGDDGAGILALRLLRERISLTNSGRNTSGRDTSAPIDFIEFEDSNINLFQEIPGYQKVIIIDTISTGKARPGEISKINSNDFMASGCAYSTHQLGIPRIFAMAKELGLSFSQDIVVYAIETNNDQAFSEDISDEVRFSVSELVNSLETGLINNIN